MIKFFVNHPTAANLLMIGILAIGLAAIPGLQRETFPRIEPRKVQISILYPGARPEDIEEAICRRIEDRLDAVDNIAELKCEARENMAIAVAEMVEGRNLDRFLTDIKTEVEAINEFPDKVEKPVITLLGRTDFVADLAVTGPDNPTDLKAYVEQLKTRMLRQGGIPKVEITGFSDHQLRIEIPDENLRRYGLSITDIANTIARQSLDLPAGSLKTQDGDILIRLAEERKTVRDLLGLIVISSSEGGQIPLGAIANISDRFALDEAKIMFDGKRAAILKITKTRNEDTLDVIEAVRAFVAHEQKTAPPGITLTITNDMSSIVRDRLNLLLTNGIQGFVLVFLTTYLFFGFRYAFWIVMGLPVSFLGAFAAMVWLGLSINMLTMVALLIVVGLLMDDAIVISENIAAQIDKGRTPAEAAITGTRQVLPGVVSSYATTACIFGSLAFLQGDIGAILRVVPIVMLLVLTISLVEAFLILPAHLHHALAHAISRPSRLTLIMNRGVDWIKEHIVGRLADFLVKWRYFTFGLAIACFLAAISAMAGGVVKFSPFPDLEGDAIEARLLLPQGTPLATTGRYVQKIRQGLQQMDDALRISEPGQQSLIKHVTILYNQNKDADVSGTHIATIRVDLRKSETRTARNPVILSRWRSATGQLPDVLALKFTDVAVGPGGIALDMRLTGPDLARLSKASSELQTWLTRYKGVADVGDNLRPGKPELAISLKPGATTLGVDAKLIADQLRTGFFGSTVRELQAGSEAYDIDLRLARTDRNSLADLDYFTITTPSGHRIPLAEVATIRPDRGVSRITRIDGQRAVSVTGELDKRVGNANEIIKHTRTHFIPGLIERYPGVSFAIEGQDKDAKKTQKSMVTGFMLGLVGVFLLLSFQFRSYVEPVVVMVVIPFAFIGAVAGHILLGLDFTMPSMLGFVALSGVVVNDSILLVNFIKEHHRAGASVAEAGPKAARARFRAILLTSLTTIAGLLPILSETSLQAQILIPLVTSLAFGLIASTLLVLFVVPAFYAILDDFGLSTLARERRAARITSDRSKTAH